MFDPDNDLDETEDEEFKAPEYASVVAFAEFLCDDERTEFTHVELGYLNRRLGLPTRTIRRDLESYGFTLRGQEHERRVRTVNDNPHDRWTACPSHGGSGWEQIAGMAGRVG